MRDSTKQKPIIINGLIFFDAQEAATGNLAWAASHLEFLWVELIGSPETPESSKADPLSAQNLKITYF